MNANQMKIHKSYPIEPVNQTGQHHTGRKKIAVLFGGRSSEYEVSLQSAYGVISHMDFTQLDLVLIGITNDGSWYHYQGPLERIARNTWYSKDTCTPVVVSPNPKLHGLFWKISL